MPKLVVLRAGDVNFSTMLSDFRHRKQVHIILVCRGSAPEALMACANEWHDFAQIAAAVPFRTPQSKVLQSHILLAHLARLGKLEFQII